MNDKLEALKKALAEKSGRACWRSLSELLASPDFIEASQGEFPPSADEPPKGGDIGRREWLKLLGASLALAGLSGCTPKRHEALIPYTYAPSGITPGLPRYYATSMVLDGFATGLVVESHEGRPTKIEGNPDHPASLGAAGVYEQASVLSLYDPHRARGMRRRAAPVSWQRFFETFAATRPDGGAGLAFLLEPTSSPLVADLIRRVRQRLPAARFTFYSPVDRSAALEGTALALGQRLLPQYDVSRAKVILSLDADFLAMTPFHLRYARQFAERRRVGSPAREMNRLYVVESMMTPTGSMADHRLRRRPSEIAGFAAALAAELFSQLPRRPDFVSPKLMDALAPHRDREDRTLVQAIARDLVKNMGAGLIIAGDRQPPIVHALAHLLNAALGGENLCFFTEPVQLEDEPFGHDISVLVDEMRRGALDTLVVLEGNPAYNAPTDLEFARWFAKVPNSIYLGLYENETAALSTWFIPAAHYLESWSDARAHDGTVSLIQPLIEPLYGGRTPVEILAVFAGEPYPDARSLLRELWASRHGDADFEPFWENALKLGLIPGSAAPRVSRAPLSDDIARALDGLPSPTPENEFEAVFLPDPSVYDGRFANNAWLLEMPDPMTKLTWDNAALISPRTALDLGLVNEDVVELELAGRALEAPVLIVPGHADKTISLHLGYGRVGAESLARGVGFNAYALRTREGAYFARGLGIRKIEGKKYPLALTQEHWRMHDRPLVLSSTLDRYKKDPNFTKGHKGPVLTLLPEVQYEGHQWAMTIDLSICTGCSACTLACQAENNVLVVGKEGVQKSREMHWLRIDTYYTQDPESPQVVHQPMLCQHCEKAPCEYVCPVNATVHSPDGLNEMIYNRCVGTRFCSNNCPYKVRRFNWFDWVEEQPINDGLTKLQRNPDVTVRQRGVMEKCTYCVQRIREAEIQAQIEGRDVRPGEVVTACQQACPTEAIQFGSLSHPDTRMARWRKEPRVYSVLHDVGTQPRTQYLAHLSNPNPEID